MQRRVRPPEAESQWMRPVIYTTRRLDIFSSFCYSTAVTANDEYIYIILQIFKTYQHSSDQERTYLLPHTVGKQILELELSQLTQGDWKDAPTLYNVLNLSYVVGAMVYHCKQLAESY